MKLLCYTEEQSVPGGKIGDFYTPEAGQRGERKTMRENPASSARKYLCQKTNRNINMLAALQAGLAEVIAAEEHGCLFCVSDTMWQLVADDLETALRLYERVAPDAPMLAVQNIAQSRAIAAQFRPRCTADYYNVWYAQSGIVLPETAGEICALRPEDAPLLARYYRLPGPSVDDPQETECYLRERIDAGVMFGLYQNGRLTGFAGTHEEGSIGLLTVLPEYRRRGIGTVLEQAAIARALERGEIPFGQVAVENAASLALQRSLGMTVADEPVCWMDR